MIRKEPPKSYESEPCSIVALLCYNGLYDKTLYEYAEQFVSEGYMSLADMTKVIKEFFIQFKVYKYFKKNIRPFLRQLDFKDKEAIACVEGHYIYIKNNVYYSFFDNNNDKVVAVWYL